MKKITGFQSARRRGAPQRNSLLTKSIRPTHDLFVHIGLPKTGTTAIQSALAANRKHLRDLGVLYPGTGESHWWVCSNVTSYQPVGFRHQSRPGDWLQLVSEITHYQGGPRLISSELLAYATDDEVDRVIRDLGPCRVLITVKPLEKMVPSYWQQRLRSGLTIDLETWCHSVLAEGASLNQSLWSVTALDIGGITQRWAERVGADNVTVLVVPSDHQWLPRQFEQLLGIPDHTLQLTGLGGANRSLTFEEADFLLHLNRSLFTTSFNPSDYHHSVRSPLEQLVKSRIPFSHESKISISSDLIRKCRQLGLQHIDRIRDLGVHVIGELQDLAPTSPIEYQRPIQSSDAVAHAASFVFSHHLLDLSMKKGNLRPRDIRSWIPPVLMPAARRLAALYRTLRSR